MDAAGGDAAGDGGQRKVDTGARGAGHGATRACREVGVIQPPGACVADRQTHLMSAPTSCERGEGGRSRWRAGGRCAARRRWRAGCQPEVREDGRRYGGIPADGLAAARNAVGDPAEAHGRRSDQLVRRQVEDGIGLVAVGLALSVDQHDGAEDPGRSAVDTSILVTLHWWPLGPPFGNAAAQSASWTDTVGRGLGVGGRVGAVELAAELTAGGDALGRDAVGGVDVGVGVAGALDSDGAAVDVASWQPTRSAPAARQQSSETSLLTLTPVLRAPSQNNAGSGTSQRSETSSRVHRASYKT